MSTPSRSRPDGTAVPSDEVDPPSIGVFGARSPVGDVVVGALAGDASVVRFSREERPPDVYGEWLRTGDPAPPTTKVVISLMPIWGLVEHQAALEALGCRRLVALSSTSRFSKQHSSRPADRQLADRLRRAEDETLAWAARTGVDVVLLRPTMIYGHERDGNVATMRRVLRRFRVFPVVGAAAGRRQPVHVADVGWAAVRLALHPAARIGPHAYTLSGGEVLTYRTMVDRVRSTVAGPTAVLRVPAWLFRAVERMAPGSRTAHTAAGMAERMASDLVFDHSPAAAAFGYAPRAFEPAETRSKDS